MSNNIDSAQEVAARGEALYRKHIKPLVDPLHYEEFVIIDVETGDYEIGKRDAEASLRLLERRPNGVIYGTRIGFSAAYRMRRFRP